MVWDKWLFDSIKGTTNQVPFFCQVFNVYLPAAYLPSQCKIDTSSDWTWTLVNTVFVSATTMFYTSIFLAVVFLWSINRQFHFKSRHSYDKEPLQPLKNARTSIKNAAKIISRNKTVRPDVNGKEDAKSQEELRLNEQRNYKSFQTFLEDFEEDEDEPIMKETASQQSNSYDFATSSEYRSNNERKKDLLQVASKIEVFSYLSPQAVADILEYVEYVDFQNVGDVVYDRETLDGSMYAVIHGEVTTHLSMPNILEQNSLDKEFLIVSGPGEVVTSMLTLVTSLVHEYIKIKGESGGSKIFGNNPQIIPPGIEVRAVISSQNTRLLRIPSRCFVAVLEKFPKDVHIICQTIIARLQRVTIQSLVRFLGIDAGILGKLNAVTCGDIPIMDFSSPSRSSSSSSELTEAISFAASLLGLTDEQSCELEKGTSIIRASPGSLICITGHVSDAIYLVLDGYLEVIETDTISNHDANYKQDETETHTKARRTKTVVTSSDSTDHPKNHFESSYRVERGAWIGLFNSFTNEASFVTARAPTNIESKTVLLKVPLNTFENVISNFPSVLMKVLLDVIEMISISGNDCLSSSMFLLDLGLDWMHVEAGQYIAIQGEQCDSMFVVLNGRLRIKSPKDDSKNQSKQEEFGRGTTIGELEALAGGQWTHSVYAIRHCEVARIPISLFNIIMTLTPGAGIHFVSNLICGYLTIMHLDSYYFLFHKIYIQAKVIASQIHFRNKSHRSKPALASILPSYALSLATVAVVPLVSDMDISGFCSHFRNAMNSIAPCKLLTKTDIKKRVGEEFFRIRNKMLKVKMTRILGDLEENNRLVIYESDYNYTWWTKLCIQQADCVVLLVRATDTPEARRVEECLHWASKMKNVQIEMVVIKTSANDSFGRHTLVSGENINRWSEERPWISKHHIVRYPFSEFEVDFHRISRRITNQSIGLVLGGGGARGLAHLGVIKALHEAGVPIDMVGGTSQGAFIGALLARSPDNFDHLMESAREMASDMSSVSNKIKDLTLPLTSFFSGHHFNRMYNVSMIFLLPFLLPHRIQI